MKRCIIFLAIILGLIVPTVSAQNVKKKVAVYVTGEADAGYKKVLGAKLVSGITRSNDYAAVERTADFLAEMTKEQDYQMSGAVSDNQIAKLGQQFGVRYVLVADVSEIFETIFVAIRMIDVQTGLIISSAEGTLQSESVEGINNLSNSLISYLICPMDINDIIVKGPIKTSLELYKYEELIPKGYRLLTFNEIQELRNFYKSTGKSLSSPIYCDLSISVYTRKDDYAVYSIDGKRINKDGSIDDELNICLSEYFNYMLRYGRYHHDDAIPSGYIYLIKE
ncbi:MAG: hypothetical protein HDS21_01140 [Bacteroides sp.]|nr:hypothetical protein [Bacteroides sp.]